MLSMRSLLQICSLVHYAMGDDAPCHNARTSGATSDRSSARRPRRAAGGEPELKGPRPPTGSSSAPPIYLSLQRPPLSRARRRRLLRNSVAAIMELCSSRDIFSFARMSVCLSAPSHRTVVLSTQVPSIAQPATTFLSRGFGHGPSSLLEQLLPNYSRPQNGERHCG